MRREPVVRVEGLETRTLLSVVAVGSEFRVNSFTAGQQSGGAVAMDADGNFVVVWSSAAQDGDSVGVYAQRFDAGGVAQGDEFLVNTNTKGSQSGAAVAIDADGDFVVAWESDPQDGSYGGVYAQRFNAVGVRQGAEFRANTYTTLRQGGPSVAMDASGDFVIAWNSDYQDGSSYGVYARRYDASGIPQGSEFRVNTYTTGRQSGPQVAADADGDFVVAWTGYAGQDGSEHGVFAQRFNATGSPQGGEFQVNVYTTGTQIGPSVGMDAAGNFVVSWSGPREGFPFSVHMRRFDAAGVPLSGDVRASDYVQHSGSIIAMQPGGDFVLAWNSNLQDGSALGVYGRRFRADLTRAGDEFRVNTYTTGNQRRAGIAVDGDGDFVVAWNSDLQDGSGDGVFAQRYGVVPEATALSFAFAAAPHRLRLTFDRDVSASLGTNDLVVQNLTTMQAVPSSDFSVSYDTTTNVATFTYTGTTAGIAGMLPDGRYTATLLAAGVTTIQGAPLAADVVLNFRFLQGDANNDGRVNLEDFNVLAANFGQSPRDFTQGDFTYDSLVNLADFNVLASRFGQVLAAAHARDGASIGAGSVRKGVSERLDELL